MATAKKKRSADKRKKKEALVPGGFRFDSGEMFTASMGDHGRGGLIGSTTLMPGYTFAPLDLPWRVLVGDQIDSRVGLAQKRGERTMRALALALRSFNTIAEEDWKKLSVERRIAELGDLHVGDFLYLAFVRLAEEEPDGWEVERPHDMCPSCEGALPPMLTVDIKEMPVTGFDVKPALTYRLKKPWHVRGELVTEVEMGSPTLAKAILPMTDDDFSNDMVRGLLWLSAAIQKINGQKANLTWSEVGAPDPTTGRGMHSKDYDGMTEAMNTIVAGPLCVVPWTHERKVDGQETCGFQLIVHLSWSEAFFVRSGA